MEIMSGITYCLGRAEPLLRLLCAHVQRVSHSEGRCTAARSTHRAQSTSPETNRMGRRW